jgi:predicted DNA-binding transcriptional regulator AlpA
MVNDGLSTASGNLVGLKRISTYSGVSVSTVKRWIRGEKFPAKKIMGSWYSKKPLVDRWFDGKLKADRRRY